MGQLTYLIELTYVSTRYDYQPILCCCWLCIVATFNSVSFSRFLTVGSLAKGSSTCFNMLMLTSYKQTRPW